MVALPDCPNHSECVKAGKRGAMVKNWTKRVYICQDCKAEKPLDYIGE